jgi:hypothetical protein
VDDVLLGVVIGVVGTLVVEFVLFAYMIRPPR